jgi:hypothetical protein
MGPLPLFLFPPLGLTKSKHTHKPSQATTFPLHINISLINIAKEALKSIYRFSMHVIIPCSFYNLFLIFIAFT